MTQLYSKIFEGFLHYLFIFDCARILCCCTGFSLVVEGWGGYTLVAVLRLLIAVAFLVAEHALQGTRASVAAERGLSSCTSGL